MKKIKSIKAIAVTLVLIMSVMLLTACVSAASESTTTGTNATTKEVDNRETEESKEETTTTAKPVAQSEFDVKEYKYEDSIGNTYYFLAIKNNSTQVVGVSFNLVAYDKSNNTIGAGSGEIDVLGPGEESIASCLLDSVKGVDHVEYELSFDDSPSYDPVIGKLEVVKNVNKKNVVVTVTNKGEKPAEYVEAIALFLNKDGKVIGYSSNYVVDNDSQIKPGAKRSAQLDVYKGFSKVEVYFRGRGEFKI